MRGGGCFNRAEHLMNEFDPRPFRDVSQAASDHFRCHDVEGVAEADGSTCALAGLGEEGYSEALAGIVEWSHGIDRASEVV